MSNDPKNPPKPVELNINLDTTPILYTDSIFMSSGPYGVILDVGQKIGDKMRIVTRIGMSRTHAKKFVDELSKLLAITEGNKRTD
jgi:hypothetical protein